MLHKIFLTLLFLCVSFLHAKEDVLFTAQPSGFVSLTNIAPSVMLDMRYYGTHNFVGRRIQGYLKPACILTRQAAEALAKAQREAESLGYSLKLFDCYRPQKAVNDFINWAEDLSDTKMKKIFYPHIKKSELFKKGYISEHSGHSRGSTVDATLVAIPAAQKIEGINMGGAYDYFDPISHTRSPSVGAEAKRNRLRLKTLMEKHGFVNYEKEWWHFTLKNEPFSKQYFDFDIDSDATTLFRISRFNEPVFSDYTSPAIVLENPMDRAVLSWNAFADGQNKVRFLMRARRLGEKSWSPWFIMGQWGRGGQRRSISNQKNASGLVDVDTLELKGAADEWQYRINIVQKDRNITPRVYALSMSFKDRRRYQKKDTKNEKTIELVVPKLSQYADGASSSDPTLSGRICSPTSVAMVLKYFNQTLPPLLEFISRAYDHEAKIYGNWPINTGLMFESLNHGVGTNPKFFAYARWYESLEGVLKEVKKGMPVIVSIQYKEGDLDGAPKPTDGHLLVVRGGDAEYIYVNDPAAPDRESVSRKYQRSQFLNAWKGMAYILTR